MKRLLSIAFAIIIALSVFTACGSGNDKQPAVDTTPEVNSEQPVESSSKTDTKKPVIESDKYAVKAVEDDFLREMNDYIVPQEEVDSDSAVSNAVISKTKITVNAVDKKHCDITVLYPDIEKEFIAALKSADEDEAVADAALYALAQKIKNDEVPLTEKNFVLDVIYHYNIYDVIRTPEFIDTLMGGMYILEEGVL